MQKMADTVITDAGLDFLAKVNNGDDSIEYTHTVLAGDDFTQATSDAIAKITVLNSIKQTADTTVLNRINDTVNLGVSFTNEKITQDYDFCCIGWYAKGATSDEILLAISPSTTKQTMPSSENGASTASISPRYAMGLSRTANLVINAEPAGSVTKEYVDTSINAIEGVIDKGSTLTDTDDLHNLFEIGYFTVKGGTPIHAPNGFGKTGQVVVYGNKDLSAGVTQFAYDDESDKSWVCSYHADSNTWSDWHLIITELELNAALPPDIARTGDANEFKAKNTFDVDPVNKTGDAYGLAKDINTKVTDNGDNSIEINKQAITPVRDNKNGSINFNSKDMTPADDSAVVHTTGDETIDGQKKFKTDPTDGAGNAYAKTIDVNQQLDKKVNVSDMRKPASDVAGIDEVALDNHDGSIQVNGNSILPSNDSVLARIDGTYTDMNNVPIGWWYLNGWAGASISNWGLPQSFYYVHCFTTSLSWDNPCAIQVAYAVDSNNVYVRTMSGSTWTSWKLTADDSKVVHTADMRKPASDVAGIEEVNAKQDKIGYTPADDSKVAHLSGANNFDTVPTVDHNPLLLASSLPADLARTGQSQTFTQPQTFSIAPVINDASTSKGDNQAATMADLKSVEDSAWRVLKEDKVVASGTCPPITSQKVLYQVDSNSNRLNLSVSFQLSQEAADDKSLVTLDFSGVIKNITGFKDGMSNGMGIGLEGGMDATYSGPKVIMNMNQQTGCWADNTFWLSYDQLAGN